MLIYVMGRGYSGSTILDILLGNSADIESVGEFAAALGRTRRETCACGTPMCSCEFWSRTRKAAEGRNVDWPAFCRDTNETTRLSRLWRYFWSKPGSTPEAKLARDTGIVVDEIAVTAGKSHVLESSKSPVRAYFLLKFTPDMRVIHLVRDPRSILRSANGRFRDGRPLRFQNRAYGPAGLRPLFLGVMALGWLVGNAIAELLARAYADRVILVRYEELQDHPRRVLRRIGEKIGLSLADVEQLLGSRSELRVGHNIGGNRLRFGTSLKFDPQAAGKGPALPRWASAMAVVVCWPLMWRYGYFGPATESSAGPVLIPKRH